MGYTQPKEFWDLCEFSPNDHSPPPPQLYVSQNQAEDKKRSVREQLLKAISEQEKKSKLLKAEQTKVRMTKWLPVLIDAV